MAALNLKAAVFMIGACNILCPAMAFGCCGADFFAILVHYSNDGRVWLFRAFSLSSCYESRSGHAVGKSLAGQL